MPTPFTAPRTSFNGAITGRRTLAYQELSLDDVKLVKNTFGVKVNDVVLTLCAGALRKYLEDRNELPDTSLVATVPVSVHDKSDRPGTNQISVMFTQLGTEIADRSSGCTSSPSTTRSTRTITPSRWAPRCCRTGRSSPRRPRSAARCACTPS